MIPSRASESLVALDNVARTHGHPFPVDGSSEVGNVWVTNIARPGLNMRLEGVVQWVGVWREWLPHVFRPEGEILLLQNMLHSNGCVCWCTILLKQSNER